MNMNIPGLKYKNKVLNLLEHFTLDQNTVSQFSVSISNLNMHAGFPEMSI